MMLIFLSDLQQPGKEPDAYCLSSEQVLDLCLSIPTPYPLRILSV